MRSDLPRCPWAGSAPDYVSYHDEEWGLPVHDDDAMFERVCLEAFQAGLSWLTILRRRQAFRVAFAGFAIERVAAFCEDDVHRLLAEPAIIRNRAKIEAALANARAALTLPAGLAAHLWSFAPVTHHRPRPGGEVPATSVESVALAGDLKRRGFRFVGPTTAYALMQATGIVDDHVAGCWRAAGHADDALRS